jgi:hypothetical protein
MERNVPRYIGDHVKQPHPTSTNDVLYNLFDPKYVPVYGYPTDATENPSGSDATLNA